eukprot:3002472-Pleurochrysis_carterae.AAC.4
MRVSPLRSVATIKAQQLRVFILFSARGRFRARHKHRAPRPAGRWHVPARPSDHPRRRRG